MENRLKLRETISKATDINLRNLFYAGIPAFDFTGKAIQAASAITQSITIWIVTQESMKGISSYISVPASILAILLICAIIEVGGRTLAKTTFRQIFWQRFDNRWYNGLGAVYGLGVLFLFGMSYYLSTRGTHRVIDDSVIEAVVFDDSDLVAGNAVLTASINTKYDKQISTLTTAYTSSYRAKSLEFDSKIAAIQTKIDLHQRNATNGIKWAKSHKDKQTGIRDNIIIQKQQALNELTTDHNNQIAGIEANRATELKEAGVSHQQRVNEHKAALITNHSKKREQVEFWAWLASGGIGVLIIASLFCIGVVEFFRRGAGQQIGYEETELPPSLAGIIFKGLGNRLFNQSYRLVKKIYVQRKDFEFEFLEQAPSLPYQVTKPKKDLRKLFGGDLYDFTEFSKNSTNNTRVTKTKDLSDEKQNNNRKDWTDSETTAKGQETPLNLEIADESENLDLSKIPKDSTDKLKCIECNIDLVFQRNDSKFCSAKCRNRFNYKKKKSK